MTPKSLRKELKEKIVPTLAVMLESCDDVLEEFRKRGSGETYNTPTGLDFHERLIMVQIMTTMSVQNAMGAVRDAAEEMQRKAQEPVPPPPSGAMGYLEGPVVPDLSPSELENIRSGFHQMLSKADIGVDLEAWKKVENLMVATPQGNSLLGMLLWLSARYNNLRPPTMPGAPERVPDGNG